MTDEQTTYTVRAIQPGFMELPPEAPHFHRLPFTSAIALYKQLIGEQTQIQPRRAHADTPIAEHALRVADQASDPVDKLECQFDTWQISLIRENGPQDLDRRRRLRIEVERRARPFTTRDIAAVYYARAFTAQAEAALYGDVSFAERQGHQPQVGTLVFAAWNGPNSRTKRYQWPAADGVATLAWGTVSEVHDDHLLLRTPDVSMNVTQAQMNPLLADLLHRSALGLDGNSPLLCTTVGFPDSRSWQ